MENLGANTFTPIIISAYDDFGIQAVKHHVFDYLLKPFDANDLKVAVQKYEATLSNNSTSEIKTINEKILIPTGSDIRFLNISDIIRCESDNNYTNIHLTSGECILISKTLKTLEKVLPKKSFLRPHNQHLINIHHILRYAKSEGGFFEMSGGTIIPISRYKKDEILKTLHLK